MSPNPDPTPAQVQKPLLVDVQKQADSRRIEIDRVGLKSIRMPVLLQGSAPQHTVADFDIYVTLPHDQRGTHMSRFVEILHDYAGGLGVESFPKLLDETRRRLHAEHAHAEARFPFFLHKKAPASGVVGLLDYEARIYGSADRKGHDVRVEVRAPVTTLCPCSKEISEYGAHNQRSYVTVAVRTAVPLEIAQLVSIAETAASCEMYSLLKRSDEKYVTERAYENPRFVEDMVRDIADRLNRDDNVRWFRVGCENLESIHSHNVYAVIERDKG